MLNRSRSSVSWRCSSAKSLCRSKLCELATSHSAPLRVAMPALESAKLQAPKPGSSTLPDAETIGVP